MNNEEKAHGSGGTDSNESVIIPNGGNEAPPEEEPEKEGLPTDEEATASVAPGPRCKEREFNLIGLY